MIKFDFSSEGRNFCDFEDFHFICEQLQLKDKAFGGESTPPLILLTNAFIHLFKGAVHINECFSAA